MSNFDKYKEVVEGKTKIFFYDAVGKPVEDYDLIVTNDEKMLLLNYFMAQQQAAQKMEPVPRSFTSKVEALYFDLFFKSYPQEDKALIRKMVVSRFTELLTSFMIGFKWTTIEQIKEGTDAVKASLAGVKKKDIVKKN